MSLGHGDQPVGEHPPLDEDWIAEQLAKAPRRLDRRQAELARHLRVRTEQTKADSA